MYWTLAREQKGTKSKTNIYFSCFSFGYNYWLWHWEFMTISRLYFVTGKDQNMGNNLHGYHLLWPDLLLFFIYVLLDNVWKMVSWMYASSAIHDLFQHSEPSNHIAWCSDLLMFLHTILILGIEDIVFIFTRIRTARYFYELFNSCLVVGNSALNGGDCNGNLV